MDVEVEKTVSTDTHSHTIVNSSIGTNSVSNLMNNDCHDVIECDYYSESSEYTSCNSSSPLPALQLKHSKLVAQVIKPSDCDSSLELQCEEDSGSTASLTPACRTASTERNRDEVKSDELASVNRNLNTIHTDVKPDCASVSKQFCRNHLKRSSTFHGSQCNRRDEILDGMMSGSNFVCATCGKRFMTNFTLRRHVKLAHKETVLPEVQRGRKPKHISPDLLICTACDKSFVNKNALKYHTKRYHHFTPERRQRHRKVTLEFSSMAGFCAWKRKEEDATLSRFVKTFGDRRRDEQKALCSTYYCHRSGRYVTKGKQVRQMKKQGSCKIGKWCPAAIFVKISNSGCVEVRYYPDHENHVNEMTHLTLRKDQRKRIAAKLAANVPYDDILKSINTEDGNSSGARPRHFVSRKDLHNITREFGIKKGVTLIDDVDSIDSSIETSDTAATMPDTAAENDIAVVDLAISSVRNIVVDNPALAKVAVEHLNKLESLLNSLKAEPQAAQLPLATSSQDPCNNMAQTQLSFESSTRRPNQQQPTSSVPARQDIRFLLCTVIGAEPIVTHQKLIEHDYSKTLVTQTGVLGNAFVTQTGGPEVFKLTKSP